MIDFLKHIWAKLVSFVTKLLKGGAPEGTAVGGEEHTPVVEIKHTPGLDCPRCGFLIQISIPMLLSGEPIFCPQCLLKLTVDKIQSKDALDATRILYDALQRAEKAKQVVLQ